MSHSPSELADSDLVDPQLKRYITGWRATLREVQRGASWSGREKHCVFLNTAGPRFADCSAVTGLNFPDDGRGLAMVDWDHDGDLDMWIYNRTSPRLRFMLNQVRGEVPGEDEQANYVAFRLRGTTCNRDAIGARVEVVLQSDDENRKSKIENSKLIRTLAAGDGFLSQSSKWIQFGLGRLAVESVVVRWPGGEPETFEGVVLNRHQVLVQGTGRATPWFRPGRENTPVQLRSSRQPEFTSTPGKAVLLPESVPAPSLPWLSMEDETRRLIKPAAKPLLLNVWASWCGPCIRELRDFTAHADQLRTMGIDVLALSIDGLDPAKGTTATDARQLLKHIQFPFDAGMATPELLDKLQLVEEWLFVTVQPFGVPMSYLMTEDGSLAAVYRGPVDIEQLIEHAGIVRMDLEQRMDHVLPFPGTWHQRESVAGFQKAIEVFHERYPEEMLRYQYLEIDHWERQLAEYRYPPRIRKQIEAQQANSYHRAGVVLLKQDKPEDAIQKLQRAVDYRPHQAKIVGDLGMAHNVAGQYAEAIGILRRAIELDPDLHEFHHNLGVALRQNQRPQEAHDQFQRALEIDPDSPHTHHVMAKLLFAHGHKEQAMTHYRRALAAKEDFFEARFGFAQALVSLARLKEGVEQFRVLAKAAPDAPQVHFHLGANLSEIGEIDGSVEHLERAAELMPDSHLPINALSLVLTSYPDEKVHDPARGLQLALRAAERTDFKDPAVLMTLAAAHAANHDFDRAKRTARSGIDLANEAGIRSLADFISNHLSEYEKNRALHLKPGQ